MTVTININKAKEITHDKRRMARAAEFSPLDIKATIPAEESSAEAARTAVREKYAVMQNAIDGCENTNELKAIIEREGL